MGKTKFETLLPRATAAPLRAYRRHGLAFLIDFFYIKEEMSRGDQMARTPNNDLSALEQQVMLAMLRLHPSAYGITIQEHIADKVGKKLSIGSIYAALDRLEDKGYAVSRRGEPTAERGGRAKLYFSLTASGEITLRRSLQALQTLQQGIRWKEANA